MIVKNEESMLPECLLSVKGWVDEIIIGDTGSTDRTIEIAKEFGARIIHIQWKDDFAAARNEVVAHAQGKYVLILDADERLSPGSGVVLRHIVETGTLDCGMMPLHNAAAIDATAAQILSGNQRLAEPTNLPRLLRRTKDLSWEGNVHESVGKWLLKGNRKSETIDAHIIHLGYVDHIFEKRKKAERNLRLLKQRVKLDGGTPISRTYLGEALLLQGETTQAMQELKKAWDSTRRAITHKASRPPAVNLATTLCTILLKKNLISDVFKVLDSMQLWGFQHPNLYHLQGKAFETRSLQRTPNTIKELQQAKQYYLKTLNMDGLSFAEKTIPGVTTWATTERLIIVALRLRDMKLATTTLQALQRQKPNTLRTRLNTVEYAVAKNNHEHAVKIAQPLMAQPYPDAWVLASFAVLKLGLHAEARVFCREALSRTSKGFVEVHRMALLNNLVQFFNGKKDEPAL